MKKLILLFLLTVVSFSAFAQTPEVKKDVPPTDKSSTDVKSMADPKLAAAVELAKKAVAAHGGEKFTGQKTFIQRGSLSLSTSFGGQTQSFPGSFVVTTSGEKYRYEINSIQSFKQVHDGEQTSSSLNGFTLPPINRLGFPLLQKFEQSGFVIAPLNDAIAKKRAGFRITSPEGYYTDFFIDEKTGMVKSYEASYVFNERTVTTSVEIDKIVEVEGVKLPEKYAQRFDLGFGTFYADFKAKETFVNTPVADDVFAISK